MKKKVKAEKNNLHKITFTLNGKKVSCEVKAPSVLLEVIRDVFELKGTKPGCNEGECGACTVLVNDAPINSCLYLTVNADGKNITTIEGLTKDDSSLDEVQESLVQNGAVQCGFCTSGMAMMMKSVQNKFKKEKRKPTRDEIKKSLEGNLCRCTGYVKIIEATETLFRKEAEELL